MSPCSLNRQLIAGNEKTKLDYTRISLWFVAGYPLLVLADLYDSISAHHLKQDSFIRYFRLLKAFMKKTRQTRIKSYLTCVMLSACVRGDSPFYPGASFGGKNPGNPHK